MTEPQLLPVVPDATVSSAHLVCISTHHLECLDLLISLEELSGYLGVPIMTIYHWRLAGHGPPARFGSVDI